MFSPSPYHIVLFLSTLVAHTTASCAHGTSFHKRQLLSNNTVKVSDFGYIGSTMMGPTQWAALSENNTMCATGTVQSPIDLTNESSTLLAPGSLKVTIPDTKTVFFENLGSTIEVLMDGKGASTEVDGKTYQLLQFHFHTPSEHTINGEHFPLEMHMVHQAEDKSLAAVAVLFQLSETGETVDFIKGLMEKADQIKIPGNIIETEDLNFTQLVTALTEQEMHSYTGSLTTPPCKEGLNFFVTSAPLLLDVATYNKAKAVIGFNSRFTQDGLGKANVLSNMLPSNASRASDGPVTSSLAEFTGAAMKKSIGYGVIVSALAVAMIL